MKKIVISIFLLQLLFVIKTFADNDIRTVLCKKVWKVSQVEVERYVYSDSALGSTYIQLIPNGKGIIKTIQHKEIDPSVNMSFSDYFNKGEVNQQSTDWSLNLHNKTLTINPSAEDRWIWKLIEVSEARIIFTCIFFIDANTSYEYKYTLIPLKGCKSLY